MKFTFWWKLGLKRNVYILAGLCCVLGPMGGGGGGCTLYNTGMCHWHGYLGRLFSNFGTFMDFKFTYFCNSFQQSCYIGGWQVAHLCQISAILVYSEGIPIHKILPETKIWSGIVMGRIWKSPAGQWHTCPIPKWVNPKFAYIFAKF